MPIDFPSSPTTGQVYTYLGKSWVYNGTGWDVATPSFLPPFAAGNAIINGAFEINQRNFTTSTTSFNFGFDRFRQANADGTVTMSSQAFTLGEAPVSGYEARNFCRLVSAGQTLSNANARLFQDVESVRTFAGQTVTVSFFAKAGSGTPKVAVELGQEFGGNGSPSSVVNTFAGQVSLTTSWARYSLTIQVPSISGKTLGTNGNDFLRLAFWVSAGSDFSSRTGSLGIQSNTFDFWGVQLEAGTVATPFRRNAPSIQAELAACQRYYTRFTSPGDYGAVSVGIFTSAGSSAIFYVPLPVEMRVAPTSVDFASPSGIFISDTNSSYIINGLATLDANYKSNKSASVNIASGSGTGAAYRTALLNLVGAGKFIGFSAEL